MSGSSPEPEAVTRSAGIGVPAGTSGFSFFRSSMRCWTVWMSVWFVGPRLEAPELSAEYGAGVPCGLLVAEGRPWKYRACVQYCPMRDDPIGLPLTWRIEPFAWLGKNRCASPVTIPG